MSLERMKVANLGIIITGNTPPRKQPELYGTHTIFIKPTDINKNRKHTHNPEECYSEMGYVKYKNSLIPKGSTCVVTIGSIGEKMTYAHQDCFINQAMNAIVPNSNFDNQYVYYLLKYNLNRVKSLDSGTASGRENVSKSAFSNMELLVNNKIEEQQKIGKTLSSYDDLMENNQKQIKLLEEAAQRLYKEWFVDLRFPGCENVEIVDDIPDGWKRGRLEDISFESGKSEKKENRIKYQYYLPIDCLPKKSLAYVDVNSIEQAESSLVAFEEGDILFGAMRPYFHKVVLARDNGLTRKTCFVLNTKDSRYWSYFVMLMFSNDTVNYATKISVGTTMPYARWKDLKNMPVLIPTEELAMMFNDIFKPISEKIKRLAIQNCKLTQVRDRLLPKLMSGEIEV